MGKSIQASVSKFMYRIRFLIATSIWVILIICAAFLSKAEEYSFKRITIDQGLSHSGINVILQDAAGFMWFGTQGGLNRYDGKTFLVFRNEQNNPASLSDNAVTALREAGDRYLLIGTVKGLCILDRYKNQVERVDFPASLSGHTGPVPISAIAPSEGDTYWIGTLGRGLLRFSFHDRSISNVDVLPDPEISGISSHLSITSLSEEQNGILWIGTEDQGLLVFDLDKKRATQRLFTPQSTVHGPYSGRINCLLAERDGTVWVGTDQGIRVLKIINSGSGYAITLKSLPQSTAYQRLESTAVSTLNVDAKGTLWVGTRDLGLIEYQPAGPRITFHSVDPQNPKSLISNEIRTLISDHTGVLWIGTGFGINLLSPHGERFVLHRRQAGATNTFSSDNIHAILTEPSGVLWIGTFDQGLNKYDPSTGIWTTYLSGDVLEAGESLSERIRLLRAYDSRISATTLSKINLVSHNRILALHRDFQRNLWIGTGKGLNRYIPSTGQIVHYNPSSGTGGPEGLIIRAITSGKDGCLWIGTEDGGLSLFCRNRFTSFRHDPGNPNSLSSDNISSLLVSEGSQLWIGTHGRGLNRLDPKSGNFFRYQHSAKNPYSISSDIVYCLELDIRGRLWVGTADGLNLYDPDQKGFIRFGTEHGLPSTFIYGILSDNSGNLWISSNTGLTKFNPDTRTVKIYDEKDGLQGYEFNIGAAFKAPSGEFLFGGYSGFNSFIPETINDNPFVPEVLLTQLRIHNIAVIPGDPGSPLLLPAHETDTVLLKHNQNTLTFEFAALNYIIPEKNKFRYIMENFDTDWTNCGNINFAHYTNLPPGAYTFRVTASNNDGIWNNTGTSMVLLINKPFWAAWWFYAIIITAITALYSGIVVMRTYKLRKTKLLLEQRVRERTWQLEKEKTRVENASRAILAQKKEIEKQRDLLVDKNKLIELAKSELDAKNEELTSMNAHLEDLVRERTSKIWKMNEDLSKANEELDLFIYRASHDLKGPVSRLLGLSVLVKMDQTGTVNQDYTGIIERSAGEMNRVIQKLTNIHHINKRRLQFQRIDLLSLIGRIKMNLGKFYPIENLNLELRLDPKQAFISDELLCEIILENLLENAFVFKKKQTANVCVSYFFKEDHMELCIHDSGLGIAADLQVRIFEMFYRGSELSRGSGLGLYLVKKAVERLNGEIKVNSKERNYTLFTIQLPLPAYSSTALTSARTDRE